DRINSVSCDLSNNIYLIGNTYSSNDISTLNSYFASQDAFIVKFNSNGVRQWGRYFGGIDNDYGNKIVINQNLNLYIAGQTASETGIATINSHQENFGGILDGFLAKFNLDGSPDWSTYYGGILIDEVNATKIDNNGNIIIAGITGSNNNIATPGEYQSTIASAYDGFLAKFNSNGARISGTYYGGSDDDRINGIAIRSNNDIVACGYTFSNTGISTPGSHQENFGGGISSDAFFAVLTDNPVINILSINPLSICEGETCNIVFEVTNGDFQSSNTFTAQLSDENGNFENPVNIGTTNGVGSGVFIAQIPLGTIPGNNYLIRLTSSNPETISSAYSQSITINSL
ncbi:MAG TPA: hypothetical protein PKY56_14360, partial [Candidatus Kapabacteria bacterium]|nr:hypothetical protein [Candidatus Kapabacteria bacterium]